MTLYVKYDRKPPYLPVAVADSKKELAQMLGVTFHSVLSSYYHKRSTFVEIEIEETNEETYVH